MLKIPKYVENTIDIIENNGFDAWCVGGAVRDIIMGKTPYDYDITTNALPNTIIKLFDKTIPTGIKHGTVTVVTDNGNIEITTFRSENGYSDYRSPDNVSFENNIDADLSRRDFTINAICYNHKRGLYDPFGGIDDISKKTIRTIGNPLQRFSEDALRILRCFRFSTLLNFNIEEKTLKAAINNLNLLEFISEERIFLEFEKIITSKYILNATPLFKNSAFKKYGLDSFNLPEYLKYSPLNFSLRTAAILNDTNASPLIFLKKLKADNNIIKDTVMYYTLLRIPMPSTCVDIKYMLKISDESHVKCLFDFYKACSRDCSALESMLQNIIDNNEPYKLSMLAVNGNDLIKKGIIGKKTGEVLNYLLDCVIVNPQLNNKDALLKIIK